MDDVTGPTGRLAVTQHGEGVSPGLILIHGGRQRRHTWCKVGAMLSARGCGSLAYDLRGHGDSDPATEGNYQYWALVEDLDCVIDRAGRPSGRACRFSRRQDSVGSGRLSSSGKDRRSDARRCCSAPASGRRRARGICDSDAEEGLSGVEEAARKLARAQNRDLGERNIA
ncbi:alpha/beta fold hydrolase [Pacificimonas sp. ICDLI1SI03]